MNHRWPKLITGTRTLLLLASGVVLQTVTVFTKTCIGVRAGGARGAAAPPNFGQLRFFGQQEKIWAKPFFKDVSVFFFY